MDERKKMPSMNRLLLESMGDNDKAIEEFKLVYSADIFYKDVADKINLFYSNKKLIFSLAERAGFEPAVSFGTFDFESGTFDHSVTLQNTNTQKRLISKTFLKQSVD